MNNLEIKNATIVDGLGQEPYLGNIYVKNGKIVAITHKEHLQSEKSIDANGKILNVQGEGVVGEFPILKPGESFEYTSGTPLKTTNRIMQGFYLMSQDNGEQLKIDIPTFSLDSPYSKKNLH